MDATPARSGACRRRRSRRAVIEQLRGVFRQPEIVVGTWRAARAEHYDITEDDAREALLQLDPLWDELFPAEQARIVQLLVDRVDVHEKGSPCARSRMNGIGALARETAREGRMTEDDRTVTVRIPLVFKKYGGRKTVITPDGHAWEASAPLVDRALVRALARAFRWRRLLDEGGTPTFDEVARAEHVSQSYVSRVLRLTLLAPDIVEAILDWVAAGGVAGGGYAERVSSNVGQAARLAQTVRCRADSPSAGRPGIGWRPGRGASGPTATRRNVTNDRGYAFVSPASSSRRSCCVNRPGSRAERTCRRRSRRGHR